MSLVSRRNEFRAAMELWGVVEGGIKREPHPGGVLADGQKYARSSYFNIKFGVLEIVRYIIWYSTEERGLQKNSEHKKYMSEKKSPLFPRYILQTYHEI